MKKEKFELKVVDYHNGVTDKVIEISSLSELKKFRDNNSYNAVWIDFDNGILWVTKYSRFSQR